MRRRSPHTLQQHPTMLRRMTAAIVGSLAFLVAQATPLQADPTKLELKPGDHICIIGNALAERMQHDGWLETYIQARFPKHNLVFRNLAFSGDEVAGFISRPDPNRRLRSMDFGTADQWLAGSAPVPQPNKLVTHVGVRDNRFELTNTKADVIFAFFGYNESFAGEAGLEKFKKDLADFIKHTLSQKYNGKSAPRLVLFSPTAFEDHKSPNLPDGRETNERLALYTKAMADVAKANNVPFVNLFSITSRTYPVTDTRHTINGVHLNSYGNNFIALAATLELFSARDIRGMAPGEFQKYIERIRQAVLDKSFYWFNRYRVMDGYNVYGGRAFEKYAGQQSNYEDQQRELEILDVKTANRDKRIWAVAQGGDLEVDDSNIPPLIPVKTNFPGNGPNGTHIFVDGEEAIKQMTIAKGMKVTLFASEKEWPGLLEKPVQMQFDPQGRLWVAVWPSYPHWKPTEEINDKILIFEDTKGTGKADKCTIFADHLHCPTGFEFYNGGVLVAQAPDLVFLKDTDGDGKADLGVRVLHGLDSADSHHTSNSFALDPGGALYFQEGTFHHTQVETPYGPPLRNANAGVYRYEPRTQKFEAYVTHPFANPHGHVWDRWGQDFVYDGTGALPFHGALFSGHLDFPEKHPHPPQVYQQRTRPCPGVEMLTSKHFPPENQGNLLVANVIGFQGILQYKVSDQGASFTATEVEPIVSSTDRNFRPSDLKIGPDGAIWFIDWHNPIIGHLQHAIRDPNRDRTHGRIYRVTYEGRSLSEPARIAGEPLDKVLELLKDPEDRVRYRARIELGSRKTEDVIAALKKWIAGLDKNDKDYEHNLLEGLWAHQYQNVVDEDLLKRLLASPDFRARSAATRVLCYWRDRVPETLELLKKLAADRQPRVRLEAVRAASFLTVPEAVEVVLIASEKPSDPYLDYIRTETMRALDPYVKKAIAEGREIKFTTAAGSRYFLKNVATDDLVKMKRTRAVYLELLFRTGVRDEYRKEALAGLAKLENQPEPRVLLDAIRSHDEQGSQDAGVVFDLIRLLTSRNPGELSAVRADLEKLATSAHLSVTRQLGFVALIAADGSIDKAWELGIGSVTALHDLVTAMPLIGDPALRSALYPKVEPLLDALPKELSAAASQPTAVRGRYVRIEMPGPKRTLALAEVEVLSNGGGNLARRGKPSQSSTARNGDAKRAADGKTATYSETQPGAPDPWWEVDMGAEFPIESITLHGRTDGDADTRLNNFTLKVLDNARQTLYERSGQRARNGTATYTITGEAPERLIRRAAMVALTSVRGQEEQTFKALARFVNNNAERSNAIAALQRIPTTYWPKDSAPALLNDLLAYIRKVPTEERTSPAALDALQLADNLVALLPADQARQVRKELGELGVRIVRIGTVLEQMRFDKERIAVRAGKPVEIVLENTDVMPHNLVVTVPGSLEEIGKLAETQATQPGALERHYVPQSAKVLHASRLLQPREVQKLSFTAPATPGVYPYVCTYPGHWSRMHGALYVVEDLDDYLAEPEVYLTKHPLPIVDPLLKDNRPRNEWKYEELVTAVEQLDHGRSFANGKQMFQVASCTACHKVNGAGIELGPDLTKLDPKLKPADILKDVIEPSFRINEKYQSFILDLDSGKSVTGLIVEEKNGVVKLIDNPLAANAKPMEIKTDEIVGRRKSNVSIMPKGLLDKLTKEEILDLMAYVIARGDAKHSLFQGGHEHGSGTTGGHGPGHQ
jgi:putative heme-binding domain-containing protein